MMVIDPFRFVLACFFLPARNGMLAQLIRGKRFRRSARPGRPGG